jgi:D-alanyl-D-alanine dipeptidase
LKYLIYFILYIFLFINSGCVEEQKEEINEEEIPDSALTEDNNIQTVTTKSPGFIEKKLIVAGLVNVREIDSTILVDLKYSSEENFLGIDLYGELYHCYLQKKPAEMLAKAQKLLKAQFPDYSLLVYDGARPLYIQQKLWDTLDLPQIEKKKYVADPKIGSIHNYGSAVDLTIAHVDGTPLDMGTPYDYFGDLAYPSKEAEMLKKGLLNEQQINNRELLRSVMLRAGFTSIKYEWWHFNAVSRERAKEIYKIID